LDIGVVCLERKQFKMIFPGLANFDPSHAVIVGGENLIVQGKPDIWKAGVTWTSIRAGVITKSAVALEEPSEGALEPLKTAESA